MLVEQLSAENYLDSSTKLKLIKVCVTELIVNERETILNFNKAVFVNLRKSILVSGKIVILVCFF